MRLHRDRLTPGAGAAFAPDGSDVNVALMSVQRNFRFESEIP
jgi:hypothetical protein